MKRLAFAILMVVVAAVFGQQTALTHISKKDLRSAIDVPTNNKLIDEDGTVWSVFTSSFLGFDEFWLAYSRDDGNTWSKPLYSAVPAKPVPNYRIESREHRFEFQFFGDSLDLNYKPYIRMTIDPEIDTYVVYRHTLYQDADADGLSDLMEEQIWTDWNVNDTDGDGKADGYDSNPLASPAENVTMKDSLHKHVINKELYYFWSNQLVIVEQFNQPMEYEREAGLILSMDTPSCDEWVNQFGYGVPILTCTVKDTLKQAFKVDFQFFYAPDDAWGYQALYRHNDFRDNWVMIEKLEEWYSEPAEASN